MKKPFYFLLLFVLPVSVFADDEIINSLFRGILAPPAEQGRTVTPPAPKVVQQYPFNPEYPNVYLGDNGSDIESLFLEMVLYGQSQNTYKHFVVISGRSSQGAFQKKIIFDKVEGLLHFQNTLENNDYSRIYLYSDRVNEAHYLIQKKPSRKAPKL